MVNVPEEPGSEPGEVLEMATEKSIDDYEYKVTVHDATDTTVTILFEEVDGNDGFAVEFPLSELEPIMDDKDKLNEKFAPHVEQRIQLLKSIKAEEEAKKSKVSQIKSTLEKHEIKVKKAEVKKMSKKGRKSKESK